MKKYTVLLVLFCCGCDQKTTPGLSSALRENERAEFLLGFALGVEWHQTNTVHGWSGTDLGRVEREYFKIVNSKNL